MWVLTLVLTLVVSAEASAQRRVTGRVTATTGEPVQAASVNVQGTTIGAYTGEDGRYTLNNVPAGAQVLVVRRIGYRRVTQPLQATSDQLDVRLEKDILQLETQVITGTTTTVSSANAANAVAAVSGEQLNRAPTPTIENALQGKVPGAVISQNSGAPGGGSQVQLRGVTSLNAASSPLYVIDGVLVNNSQIGSGVNSITAAGGGITNSQDQPVNRIADLNPADIESIEVLKGASAGAIYGSKASNGVIVITTRKGATGRPQGNITQRVGQFSLARKLGLRCFGSAAEAEAALPGSGADYTASGGACHDFESEFYGGNPLSYETDLSLRGGSGGTTFYVGGLAKRDNAIQRNTYYQKQSVTANLSQLLGTRVTLRSNNEFVHSLTDRGISGNDNQDIVSPGDIFSATPTFIDLAAGQPNPYLASGSNPFQNADLVKNPEDVYRYIGSVNTTYSAYTSARQTLDFTFIGGVDAYSYNSSLNSPPEAYFEPNDKLPGTIVKNKSQNVNANLNLSGAHKFIADIATATTSFGLRQERRQQDLIYNQGRNVPSGAFNVSSAAVQQSLEQQFLVKDFAYFAQEEVLALDERLLLTGAINAERSSVNGDDKKFYSYPKAAASYRLPWLPRFTDELKLRAAWGRAGNQPPYGNKFTALITSVNEGVLGARPSTIVGASDIRPEISEEVEGGVDMQMFGGRMALDATVFRKKVTDLILSIPVATTSGFGTKNVNAGALQNTGTEVGLNITPIQTSRVTWVSRTTYANVDGRITSLRDPQTGLVQCGNFGAFFSTAYGAPYVCEGYSPSSVQARNGFDSTFSCGPAGTCNTGTYIRRSRHLSIYESAPDFNMGFSNEINVGPVRLYGLLEWRKGGKVANLTNAYFDLATNEDIPTGMRGDTAATIARNKNFLINGRSYLESASFAKLREISVSYTIPSRLTQSVFPSLTQDVRLEVSGRNLKTWTNYTGYDPEVSNFSNQTIGRFQDVTPYPPSRSIFVSLSANF
ncbi:MAG: SusC/RagA family TonB-linked outer membrane protein [Gemmatimonadaceae bacterium]|nr:SusC/RagA family TonB-linked outer membrane protein [Gemmatimonadaceae bacterium]NUO93809.1 SusC/RagA family TonB-linked outer membrane protein [Gemmatimonadaceae bacterium]NUP70382.1 SusC/RagA family TonB-linked outer membrane protein [Gemmatimonadaceae bacterium]NUR32653.1 SusC/RagA family TonB-linked outer membrane protein [Gemmatimonadaceae bacterium]